MTDLDRITSLRALVGQLERRVDNALASGDISTPASLFQIVDHGKNPTAVPGYFAAIPARVQPGTAECEGCPGPIGVGADGDARPILVLGPRVPKAGDNLLARQLDGRWVSQDSGTATSKPPSGRAALSGCFCDVPTTLQMTSVDPSCNYGMFQSCSIAYGPPNGSMQALGFTSGVFTSQAMFYDQISKSSFFYYFFCHYNQFFLTRIYPASLFGSVYRDAILYTWTVGGYGNTCTPFALLIGSAYPGSDASCSVGITG